MNVLELTVHTARYLVTHTQEQPTKTDKPRLNFRVKHISTPIYGLYYYGLYYGHIIRATHTLNEMHKMLFVNFL